MQKSRNKVQTLVSYLCALTFVYTYSSTPTFGATSPDVVQVQTQEEAASNSLFSAWIKPKKSSSIQTQQQSSGEIWGRVRNRLSLNGHQSQPLMQRHVKSFAKHQDYINKVVKNATPYLYYILEEVEKRGMPAEIALLPIIESDFNPQCTSHKGAAGLWQIMPSLGKLHGLKQNSSYDGRRDVYESTKVALDHLSYLHKKFNGNWYLALAAYNSGETKVQRAIKNNKSAKKGTDFWSLSLPKETTHFVPKLLAFAAIIKAPKQYGVVLPAIPNQPVFARVSTSKTIDISHAAKLVDVSETQLRRLNPGHKKTVSAGNGPMHLLVPIHQAETFKAKINKTPVPSASATITKVVSVAPSTTSAAKVDAPILATTGTTRYSVKPGDTLNKIAKKFHTTKSAIKELNHLKNDKLAIGKSLSIPEQVAAKTQDIVAPKAALNDVAVVKTTTQSEATTKVTAAKQKIHVVKRGESIPKISKKYKVKEDNVLALNGLKRNSIIQPGQHIIISNG
jgi:membrane-bound lytic murein transglycosylase D